MRGCSVTDWLTSLQAPDTRYRLHGRWPWTGRAKAVAHWGVRVSGPKGASYVVVSAAELERRALARAQARLADVTARFQELQADTKVCRKHYDGRVRVAAPPRTGSLRNSSDHDRAATQLKEALARAQATFAKELSAARADAITVGARSVTATADVPAAQSLGSYEHRAAPAAPDPAAEIADGVARALLRVAIASEADQAKITHLAQSALATADTGRGRVLLRVLQDEVQKANAAQQARDRRTQEVRSLRGKLQGRDGAAVEAADAALQALVDDPDRPMPPDLPAQVEAAAVAADAGADRAFTLQTAAACLGRLGYEVAEGFDTVVARGGFTYLRRASWAGYAVQLRAAADNQLGFNVVREDDGTIAMSTRDVEVEQEWCADFERLRQVMSAEGVQMMVTRATPPGALPVQRVKSGVVPTRRTVRHGEANRHQRSLQHGQS